MENKYDVVVIGGGLGGLSCGTILSKEGMSVCVLEQHKVAGGCLQSFKRKGCILDSGIHYVGSMAEGQTMHQYLKYFGILNDLKIRKLDNNAYDVIRFADGTYYNFAMGYDNFFDTFVSAFPHERKGLREYCTLLKKVGSFISPEILREGRISAGGIEYMGMSIYDEMRKMIGDERLINVLSGSISQYNARKDKASVYEHSMINHSNIEGSYAFEGGTQSIADALVGVIRKNGGEVRTSAFVSKIHLENGIADYVELKDGERIFADKVISTIHPAQTLEFLDNNTVIKKAYFTRVNSLENSFGIFSTYLIMKPGMWKHINSNFYLYENDGSVWATHDNCLNDRLESVLVCMQKKQDSEYCDVVTLLTPMLASSVEKWKDTAIGRRGEDYLEFKDRYSGRMIDFAERFLPGLKAAIDFVYTASPLTYRDYTMTPDGTAYGIIKDYQNPIVNHLPARTKIPNLYFSGQNLNLHGCIGVSVSAAVTCGEILGEEYLSKKIGNA